jgi:hypothetical protein
VHCHRKQSAVAFQQWGIKVVGQTLCRQGGGGEQQPMFATGLEQGQ